MSHLFRSRSVPPLALSNPRKTFYFDFIEGFHGERVEISQVAGNSRTVLSFSSCDLLYFRNKVNLLISKLEEEPKSASEQETEEQNSLVRGEGK